MNWVWFLAIIVLISILIGWIVYGLLDLYDLYYFETGISYLFGGINFILSIIIKVFYKESFFCCATISASIVLAIILIITAIVSIILQIISKDELKTFNSRINKLSNRLLNVNLKDFDDICADYHKYHNSLNKIEEEIKKKREEIEKITPRFLSDGGKQKCLDELNKLECSKNKLLQSFEQVERKAHSFIDLNDVYFYIQNDEKIKFRIEELKNKLENEQTKSLEKQKQQLQNEAATQLKANEDEIKKGDVERNIDQLSEYIDKLGVYIQKKELPDVQMVSELSKILDSILNKKSYISKEYFNKVRDDNKVFIKHVLKKCHEIENFSDSLSKTRMKQVKEKFTKILK